MGERVDHLGYDQNCLRNWLSQWDVQHLLWFKSYQHRNLRQKLGTLPVMVQSAVPAGVHPIEMLSQASKMRCWLFLRWWPHSQHSLKDSPPQPLPNGNINFPFCFWNRGCLDIFDSPWTIQFNTLLSPMGN